MTAFRDRKIADDFHNERTKADATQCRHCKDTTEHQTLCSLGGVCSACFRAYCQGAMASSDHPPLDLAAKRAIIAKMQRAMSARGSHQRLPNSATPAERLIENLSTFEQRTGRPLHASQRHVLNACRKMLSWASSSSETP
jgi:hypothetical protein